VISTCIPHLYGVQHAACALGFFSFLRSAITITHIFPSSGRQGENVINYRRTLDRSDHSLEVHDVY